MSNKALLRFVQRGLTTGTVLALALGVASPAGATDPSLARRWALTRTSDGHLQVVRGIKVAIAQADADLGRTSTSVVSVEDDATVGVLGDPMRSDQWALDKVSYEATWGTSKGSGVIVAVVDTGIAAGHQDLAGSVIAGTDLASDAASVDPGRNGMVDPGAHGTHVAGIIAAHANNNIGISGAAPGAWLMPVRVLDAHGTGTASTLAEGIIWAADHGARVINVSVGGGPSSGEQLAIQYAMSKKAVVVAAAGNAKEHGNPPTYPAAYPEAIAVASVNSSLQHSPFSNTGAYVDIAAPGEMILSTYGGSKANDYAWMSGTSMATPYVSAAAALVIGAKPSLSAVEVSHALRATATALGSPGRDDTFGDGLVNPRAAVTGDASSHTIKTTGDGYWIVKADGRVQSFGSAKFYGDLGGIRHTGIIVAGARTQSGHGYWLAGSDGAVYSFGDARYHGSMYGTRLNGSIVGMAATPSGKGYVLLGQDGGIFTFGNAHFYGSTGGMRLNAPVLDMAMTSNGHGYWFVAGDGGVFSFGNARFHGSTGSMRLAAPMRSMTAAANGNGYWLVAADGGIFAFNVPFKGSLPGVRAGGTSYAPTVRMRGLRSSDGYYLLSAIGGVSAFGAAKSFGSSSGPAVDAMLAG
jgi:subtilisin family serine protease